MTYPIPNAALDDRLGIVGTAGAGKTYTALGAIERLLSRKARAVAVDPLGVMWGLRLMADGKTPSPYPVVIFGGTHGDLPLTENAGAILGETVATMAESCIVDLSGLPTKAAERRFMLAFLEAIYRHTDREKVDPYHLIVDEADRFAPQKPPAGDEMLLNRMEEIVRRGRVKGFIPWLITQRPAVLNKNVLSQADGLIALKLTSSQDRDQIGDWVEGQTDRETWKRMRADLPTLQRGEAIVWIPGRGVFERVTFPTKATFDSSRSPTRGERKHATELKPLDLGSLKARLASVEAETKANDPKALKARIAELEREKKKQSANITTADIQAAEKAGYERGHDEGGDAIMRAVASLTADLANSIGRAETACADAKRLLSSFAGFTEEVGKDRIAKRQAAPVAQRIELRVPDPKVAGSTPAGRANSLDKPLHRIIDAIRWWNVLGVEAPSHSQAAFIAGYSHKSGTWATYLSRLRSMELIEGRGDLLLTSKGAAIAGDPDVQPSGDLLRATVLDKVDGPLARILQPIMEAYPQGLSHADAAKSADYSPQSGTWATYLSRLRSLDLIDGRGELRAQDWLFP